MYYPGVAVSSLAAGLLTRGRGDKKAMLCKVHRRHRLLNTRISCSLNAKFNRCTVILSFSIRITFCWSNISDVFLAPLNWGFNSRFSKCLCLKRRLIHTKLFEGLSLGGGGCTVDHDPKLRNLWFL